MVECISRSEFQPAYLRLYESGELKRRVEQALELLKDCKLCPRDCGVDRWADKFAVCKTGRYAVVSSHFPHFGEEDCLRGWKGSGTIFFSWCNLRCVFCQNYDISWVGEGRGTRPEELAQMMLRLQERGCHNINFVTPEHVVPQILEGLYRAVERGLRLPLVYNTSAYDSLDSIQLMDGVIDIYMPDFKFWDPEKARHYVKAVNYPEAARQAIKEMHRQVGELVFDENGLALRGVLLRHLVMPGGLAGTQEIMEWVARELGPDTYVNVMAQYYPAGKVNGKEYVQINRHLTEDEFQDALGAARAAGLRRLDARAAARLV
ncbi:radical SAM protein [Acidobacteriia bacterium AH_259_A11_L15]|nr:radical SAM protein [Acidobacteriia bacterium AH_259_A11_L15]